MEWSTFIKWNVISYTVWYGTNLLIDYLRFRDKNAEKPSNVQTYSLVLEEKPQMVNSVDYKVASEDIVPKAVQQSQSNEQIIRFEATVEHQGIPFQVFMQNAKQISQSFNF